MLNYFSEAFRLWNRGRTGQLGVNWKMRHKNRHNRYATGGRTGRLQGEDPVPDLPWILNNCNPCESFKNPVFLKVPCSLQSGHTNTKTINQEESPTPLFQLPTPTNWEWLPRELCGKRLWGWVQRKKILWFISCVFFQAGMVPCTCHSCPSPVSWRNQNMEKIEQLITILSWTFLLNKYPFVNCSPHPTLYLRHKTFNCQNLLSM